MRKLSEICLAILAVSSLWTSPTFAQRASFKEPEVEAAFLFNFAQFVEWPPEAFPSPQSPIVIGVLGDDPFGGVLDDLIKGEVVRNRPLVVERFRRVDDIKTCHILFISRSERRQYARILSALDGRPILTVGETEDFGASGGVIRFMTDQNHIRLRINVGIAKSTGLSISSNLLRPAEVVGAGTGR